MGKDVTMEGGPFGWKDYFMLWLFMLSKQKNTAYISWKYGERSSSIDINWVYCSLKIFLNKSIKKLSNKYSAKWWLCLKNPTFGRCGPFWLKIEWNTKEGGETSRKWHCFVESKNNIVTNDCLNLCGTAGSALLFFFYTWEAVEMFGSDTMDGLWHWQNWSVWPEIW